MSACEADHLHFTTTTISHREKELSAGMQVSFADEADLGCFFKHHISSQHILFTADDRVAPMRNWMVKEKRFSSHRCDCEIIECVRREHICERCSAAFATLAEINHHREHAAET